jgi:hypothetical protein
MLASEVLCRILLQGLVASGEQDKAKTEKNSAQHECTNGHSGRTKWSFHLTNGHFRLSAKFGFGHTVWLRFSTRMPFCAPFSHPCPCPHRFWTNGTYSGRTGRLADERAGSPSGDGRVWAYGLWLFDHTLALAHTVFATPLPLPTPFQDERYIFWMNGPFGGRTGRIA